MATSVELIPDLEHLLKSLVTKSLGKRLKRHAIEICLNIKLVDIDLKPAYLFDYGVTSAEDIVQLLQELCKSKYIYNRNLIVLIIGADYLVKKVSTIRMFCETNFDWMSIFIVDISKSIEKPYINKCENIIRSLKDVVQKMSAASDDVIVIEIDPKGCNVSTLFGFLLGYPVLYWYETKDGESENCLTMEPLTNYKIEGLLHGDSKSRHLVYSFSVPQCLKGETCSTVKGWFSKLYKKPEWETIFSDIYMTETKVQLEAVTL